MMNKLYGIMSVSISSILQHWAYLFNYPSDVQLTVSTYFGNSSYANLTLVCSDRYGGTHLPQQRLSISIPSTNARTSKLSGNGRRKDRSRIQSPWTSYSHPGMVILSMRQFHERRGIVYRADHMKRLDSNTFVQKPGAKRKILVPGTEISNISTGRR